MGVRDQPIAPSSPWHRVRHAIPALRLQSEKTRGPCGLGIGIMAASSFCRTLFVARSIGRIANDRSSNRRRFKVLAATGPGSLRLCHLPKRNWHRCSTEARVRFCATADVWVGRCRSLLRAHLRHPHVQSPISKNCLAGLAAGSPVWRLTLNEHAARGFTRFARAW
jgi:hypothetical protein